MAALAVGSDGRDAQGNRAVQQWTDATEQLSRQRLTERAAYGDSVAVARTGRRLYHISELPRGVDADPDGVGRVHRPASKVFDDQVITSFDNAPVTLCHPYEVDADSWGDLAVGVVRNPHRDGDHLVADFFFTDRRAVDLVRNRGL
jgi:uncharacterized protein